MSTWNPGNNTNTQTTTTQAAAAQVPPVVPAQNIPASAGGPQTQTPSPAQPPIPPTPQAGNVQFNGASAPYRTFFGGPLGAFSLTSRMNEVFEEMKKVLEDIRTKNPQMAQTYKLLPLDAATEQELGYDTIMVVCTHTATNGNSATAFMPMMVVNNAIQLAPSKVYSMQVAGQMTELPNKASDLLDAPRTKLYASLVKQNLAIASGHPIYMSGAVAIPDDMNLKSQEGLQNLVALFLQALYLTDVAAVSAVYGKDIDGCEPNDLVIAKLKGMFPNMTFTQQDRPQNVQTLTGQPVASDSRGMLTATSVVQNNNPNASQPNNYYTQASVVQIPNQMQVLTTDVHIDVQFVGQDPTVPQMPQMPWASAYGQQPVTLNAFVPVIQILRVSTDQPQSVRPSLGQLMLGVALATQAYGNQSGWVSALTPTHDAGVLVDKNRHLGAMGWMLPGITGPQEGGAIQGAFVDFNMGNRDEVSQFLNLAMQKGNGKFLVTLDVEEIGESTAIQKILLAAADQRPLADVQQGRIDALAEICNKINLLTGFKFQQFWPDATRSIFSPAVCRLPLFYTISGDKRRDGREWDFLRMLNKFGETNPEVLHRYTRSLFDQSFSMRDRSAETLRLLQTMLDGTPMHHTSWYQRLTFDGAFLEALCRAVQESNLLPVYNGAYHINNTVAPMSTYTNVLTGGFMSNPTAAGFFTTGNGTMSGNNQLFQQPIWGSRPIA